jgi:hypothetical protein
VHLFPLISVDASRLPSEEKKGSPILALKAKHDGSEVALSDRSGGPPQALTYVGRYTHRIAIAISRLLSIEDDRVRFCWKD